MTQHSLKLMLGSFVALFLLGISPALLGQAVNGTLLGTVTDTSGAVVTKAKVTATLTTTGAVHVTVTNASGNYTFPDMQPGVYTIAAEVSGFKKIEQNNVNLLTNSTVRINLVLQPGEVTQSITVTTAPALLQTDRADISTKLQAVQIEELPLMTNSNFQSLLNLVPGTEPVRFEHSQFFNPQDSLQTEINGMSRLGNLYQIEGIDDDERTGLLQILIPPAAAIQSVDISTNDYDAELGRAIGAVTNVTLKSGTNSLHGSAFEEIQNNAVDARSYFSGPLGHLAYNYFGGSIGGPIVKNNVFFFGDYLRTTDGEQIASTFTVPDSRWYTPNSSGNIDLSGALQGGKGQIYDPATGDGTKSSPRKPFPNNQIPLTRVNPVSLAILKAVDAAASKLGTLNSTEPLYNPSNNYQMNVPFTKTQTASTPRSIMRRARKTTSAAAGAFSAPTLLKDRLWAPSWAALQPEALKPRASKPPIAPAEITITFFRQPSLPRCA